MNPEAQGGSFPVAQQPRRDGEGAGACTRLSVSVCVFVCVCVHTRECAGTGGPRPRGEPGPARRGAAGQHQVAPSTSCGAARAGKSSHPLRLQNKSSGACAGALLGRRLAHRTTCPFPARKVFVLRVFVVLPAFVLRPPPCSAGRGRSLKRGGLFSCGCAACPCRGALPQPRARRLRVLPGREEGG